MHVPRVSPVDAFTLFPTKPDAHSDCSPPIVERISSHGVLKISTGHRCNKFRPHARFFGDLASSRSSSEVTETDSADEETALQDKLEDCDLNRSVVEEAVLSLWERCSQKGMFRYDVSAYRTSIMSGSHEFLLQLNDGRSQKKRASEFCVDKVVQPFDDNKFNFTKALLQEVLFEFNVTNSKRTEISIATSACQSPDLVMINFCPIEYGHILLVPRIMDKLPQLVNAEMMRVALHFTSAMGSPYFRLLYNSFGAFASVNHMHFQGYFLMAPFPSERAPTMAITPSLYNSRFLRVSTLTDYPVRGWVFEMIGSFDQALPRMADAVGRVCMKLQAMDIPHNLMIADCGARVFLWPQCFQERRANGLVPDDIIDTDVAPAVSEIAGHMIVKRRNDFESFTQTDVWRLLSYASLDASRFTHLTKLCLQC